MGKCEPSTHHFKQQPALLLEGDVHDEDEEGDDEGDDDDSGDQGPLPCGIPTTWEEEQQGGGHIGI